MVTINAQDEEGTQRRFVFDGAKWSAEPADDLGNGVVLTLGALFSGRDYSPAMGDFDFTLAQRVSSWLQNTVGWKVLATEPAEVRQLPEGAIP